MKTLKFRAWNGITMDYNIIAGKFGAFWVNPGVNNDGLDINDSHSLTPFNTKCADTTEIMQFTGLKDKNGRDIYEGDILQRDAKYKYIVTNESCNYVLFHTKLKNSDGTKYCWGNLSRAFELSDFELEVIGNIHQNPELWNE